VLMKKISYSPLWKTLIDRKWTKSDLRQAAELSRTTITKMGKDESVTLDVILRIATVLNCPIYDIVEIVEDPDEEQE